MPQTPGVYIEEADPFPQPVTPVNVAIPIFIGYTQKAGRRGKSLVRHPIKVESLKQYIASFGHCFNPRFKIVNASPGDPAAFLMNHQQFSLQYCEHNTLFLYQAVQLFFLNGGTQCYILSVGIYGEQSSFAIKGEDFTGTKGKKNIFKLLDKVQEPALVVLPDVIANPTLAYPLYQQLLQHCATGKHHFAILDVGQPFPQNMMKDLQEFRQAIGSSSLQYGAAYYPWLHSVLIEASDVSYVNLDPSKSLQEILSTSAPAVVDIIKQIGPGLSRTKKKNIQLALLTASPDYSRLMQAIQLKRNIVPPSGAVAGVYNFTDNSLGVWKAPANASLQGVASPVVKLTDVQQQGLLADVTGGKYINAIRTFTGKGTLVWGARTLDGNSPDWRYVSVRRSIMMLELAISKAIRNFIFEPNTAATWLQCKAAAENFLFTLWKQGALAGTKPQDAYHVAIGLGSTMTANDVMEGRMLMQVMAALARPAEFIVISFEQQQHALGS